MLQPLEKCPPPWKFSWPIVNPSKNSTEKDKPVDPEYARIYKVVQEALKGFFKPEFLNRLDEVIVFKPLTMSDVDNIATIMLSQLEERVVEQGFTIEVDSLAKAVLTKAGYVQGNDINDLVVIMTLTGRESWKIAILAFLQKYSFFVKTFIVWALFSIPWNITSFMILNSMKKKKWLIKGLSI